MSGREYEFIVPVRGVRVGTVTAKNAKEAARKVEENHPDVQGWDTIIDWTGRPKVRLDRPR